MHGFPRFLGFDSKTVQRSALCRSRRELSNADFLAIFGFDTTENEPCQISCPEIIFGCCQTTSREACKHLRENRPSKSSATPVPPPIPGWVKPNSPAHASSVRRRPSQGSRGRPSDRSSAAYPRPMFFLSPRNGFCLTSNFFLSCFTLFQNHFLK